MNRPDLMHFLTAGVVVIGCVKVCDGQVPNYLSGPQREAAQYRDHYGYFHGYHSNSPLPPSYHPGPAGYSTYGISADAPSSLKQPSLDHWLYVLRRVPPLTAEEKAEIAKRREDRGAHLEIKVPENAELWLQNKKMSQSGAVRQFQSPPLEAGRKYTYRIRVRWEEGGKTITRNRQVKVEAGAKILTEFRGS